MEIKIRDLVQFNSDFYGISCFGVNPNKYYVVLGFESTLFYIDNPVFPGARLYFLEDNVGAVQHGKTYRHSALGTMNHDFDSIRLRLTDDNIVLLNAALGLSGEAGEFTDKVKKMIFHGQEIDREFLIKELGDVRWYLEAAMIALQTNLEEVENKNIEKLQKRYPNGFNVKDAEARVDTKE